MDQTARVRACVDWSASLRHRLSLDQAEQLGCAELLVDTDTSSARHDAA